MGAINVSSRYASVGTADSNFAEKSLTFYMYIAVSVSGYCYSTHIIPPEYSCLSGKFKTHSVHIQ
jgi:hypothetical protein